MFFAIASLLLYLGKFFQKLCHHAFQVMKKKRMKWVLCWEGKQARLKSSGVFEPLSFSRPVYISTTGRRTDKGPCHPITASRNKMELSLNLSKRGYRGGLSKKSKCIKWKWVVRKEKPMQYIPQRKSFLAILLLRHAENLN